MNSENGKSKTPVHPLCSAVAYREFCYRWTCDCGAENRVAEIIAGNSNICYGCQKAVKMKTIVYDNGCSVKIG